MLCSMDEAQSEPIRPTAPDMHWTGWALSTLREAAEIDMRCKRLIERQQERAHHDPKAPPAFGLIQARLTRSVRLTVALTDRIRTGFMTRRDERKASGEEDRRRQRRERAAQMVGEATAQAERGVDAERMRSMAWESLVEDEMLDAQLDTLSAEEFVRAVCRKIGHPPVRLPQSWDEGCEMKPVPPTEPPEAADREATDDWSAEPGESDTGRPMPEPPQPDSSKLSWPDRVTTVTNPAGLPLSPSPCGLACAHIFLLQQARRCAGWRWGLERSESSVILSLLLLIREGSAMASEGLGYFRDHRLEQRGGGSWSAFACASPRPCANSPTTAPKWSRPRGSSAIPR
jgi:hypothetical protein